MSDIEQEFGFGSFDGAVEFPTTVAELNQDVEVADTYRNGMEGSSEEDVWDSVIDHEVEEAVVKATLPPGGWYEVPKATVTRSVKDVDVYLKVDNQLKLVNQSRQVGRVSGRGFHTDSEGNIHSPFIRFTICPQIAYGVDFETKVPTEKKLASSYKLYVAASNAYKKVFKQAPRTPGDVVAYLETHPFKVRTFQGSDGLVALDIEPIFV